MAPSIAWIFFKVNKSNDTFCKCTVCNVSISRGGKTAKTFTTSNMMNHLKKFHPDALAKETGKMKRRNADAGCLLATNKFPAKTQTTLTEMLEKKQILDINDHRSKDMHYLIGEMIAVDLQPYSVVSDLGFQRLLKKITPRYNIPSRKYFSENIIPDIYQKVQTKIQKSVNDANYISLTTDIWTATTNNSPFLSVTDHWLTDQFQQERAVLQIVPFEGSHTGARISEELSNVLEHYKLTNDNIFLVLRDSGANMVAGVRNCGLESLSCFIHTLQLSLNESIFAQQGVKTIITTIRNIVKYFNHSAVAVSKLTELQEQLGLKKHKLIQDVPTHWNSTYYMLERNIEQRKALVRYAVEDSNIPTLSAYQWSLAEKIVQLIKPFEEITVEASKREATSSIIIPTIQTLKLFLSKAKTSISFAGTRTTVEELHSSVENRFSAYLENKSLCLSSLLDSRFKMKFQRTDMVAKIKEWTLVNLENADASECGGYSIEDSSTSEDDEEHGGASLTFSNLFDELASGKRKNDDEEGSQRKKQKMKRTSKRFCCDKELEEYLNLPLLPRHDDPFLWWRNSKEVFPHLSKLALKYLSAPASSIESERVFSTGEAVSCLENLLRNIQRPPDFNIDVTSSLIHHCHEIIQQLMVAENDQFLRNSLGHLMKCLESHQRMVTSKNKRTEHHQHDVSSSEKGTHKQNRVAAIEDSIFTKGQLSFEDVAGLSDAKQALYEAIIMPLQYPHLFTGNRRPWRRILLYGPPGTGKSRLALALSSEITSTFYSISSADLLSSWVGESEKSIKELFQHACQNKSRSVIFIDEIDSLCRKRNVQEEEHTRRFKTELLKQMEGVGSEDVEESVFLLCATNCPWELDVAFLRRFQKRIYIPLPDKDARLQLFQIHTKKSSLELSDEDWDSLAEKTQLYSGSDIANLTLGALFQPIREMQRAKYWKWLPDGKFLPCEANHPSAIHIEMKDLPAECVVPNEVKLDDFFQSMHIHHKTINDSDLKQFRDFTKSFGELG